MCRIYDTAGCFTVLINIKSSTPNVQMMHTMFRKTNFVKRNVEIRKRMSDHISMKLFLFF